jgi:L-lactate dehydrogenase complex protein LldG
MSPRDAILAAVRRNLPRRAVPLPEIPGADRKGIAAGPGYKDHLTRLPEVSGAPDVNEPRLPYFLRQLEAMGGRSFEVADAAAARAKVAELFPDANVVCSAVSEVPGTRRIEDVRDPHELNDLDVGVVRSPLGVAEAGAVWLTQANLGVNALGVLSQHLVVLLDPAAVVETMHDAYGQIDLAANPYGVFLAGPSATGDIEG